MDRIETFCFFRRCSQAQTLAMKYLWPILWLILAGCSSPTAPTPPPAIVVTPPVVAPPVVTPPPPPPPPPPPAFPPNDVRFDMTYYRQLVHNAYDARGGPLQPLRRQREAPRIYLRTIDDGGQPLDALTLDQTAAALESTAGRLTGVFGLAGLERGTGTRRGQPGWITVEWIRVPPEPNVCGQGAVGGDWLRLYHRSNCSRCSGGPAVALSTIKHELGHVLGFWHTDSRDDLMYPNFRSCDLNPSEREIYHAAVAYTRPIGSPAP